MAKRGPKPVEIDWQEFNKLCEIQCTLNEIAGWYDCSIDTIENRVWEKHDMKFSDYYNQKRQPGKISLRRRQYKTAMEGNAVMQLWLGKQWLGQVDKQEMLLDTPNININISKDDAEL